MNIGEFSKSLPYKFKRNSPVILSVAAGVGTVVTAYLTARASFKAAEVILNHEAKAGVSDDPKELLIERTKLVWRLYIPAVVSGSSTIVCVVGANRIGTSKLIAANSAIAVADRAFSEYRDKVVEQYSNNKEQTIRDKIAEDKVKATAPSKEVMLLGDGHILCCELYTGRYFLSDMESLRKAQNNINSKINSHMYASLSDFYYDVNLAHTSVSSNLGWEVDRQMNLEFSTVLTEDGRPCLAFEYNYVTTL